MWKLWLSHALCVCLAHIHVSSQRGLKKPTDPHYLFVWHCFPFVPLFNGGGLSLVHSPCSFSVISVGSGANTHTHTHMLWLAYTYTLIQLLMWAATWHSYAWPISWQTLPVTHTAPNCHPQPANLPARTHTQTHTNTHMHVSLTHNILCFSIISSMLFSHIRFSG